MNFEWLLEAAADPGFSSNYQLAIVGCLAVLAVVEVGTLLTTRKPHSPVQFGPGFLTALGILGTFLGIAAGLKDIDLSSPEAMMAGTYTLLGGMETAFGTSLAGLGSAAILMVGLGITGAFRRSAQADREKRALDSERAAFDTLSSNIQRIADASQASDDAARKLGEASERLVQSLSGFSAEAIGQHVREGFRETVQQEVSPTFNKMEASLESIQRTMANQNEDIIKALLVELRREVIEPLGAEVRSSAEATKRATEAVETLHAELGDMSLRLAGAAEKLDTFQTRTLQELNKFASSLDATLRDFQEETGEILRGVATGIDQAVTKSVGAMEHQQQAFESSAERAAAAFQGIRTDLEAALEKQANEQRDMLEETRSGVVAVLTEAQGTFDAQTRSLEATGNKAVELMDRSRETLEATLTNIDTSLQATRQTVQDELARFREQYQAALTSFFEEQNNLLEGTLGEQREGLHAVVRELNDVFGEAAKTQNEQLERATTTVEAASDLAAAVANTSSAGMLHVREAAQEIGRQSQELGRRHDRGQRAFDESVDKLEGALGEYLEKAQAAYAKDFDEMDRATTRISEQLLAAAQVLATAKAMSQSSRSAT